MPIGTLTALGLGLGAAAGAAKAGIGAEKAQRERKLAASTQAYSPWTGMQAGPVHDPDVLGDVLQGATSGGMQGQAFAGATPPVPQVPGASGIPAGGFGTDAAGMKKWSDWANPASGK